MPLLEEQKKAGSLREFGIRVRMTGEQRVLFKDHTGQSNHRKQWHFLPGRHQSAKV